MKIRYRCVKCSGSRFATVSKVAGVLKEVKCRQCGHKYEIPKGAIDG